MHKENYEWTPEVAAMWEVVYVGTLSDEELREYIYILLDRLGRDELESTLWLVESFTPGIMEENNDRSGNLPRVYQQTAGGNQ